MGIHKHTAHRVVSKNFQGKPKAEKRFFHVQGGGGGRAREFNKNMPFILEIWLLYFNFLCEHLFYFQVLPPRHVPGKYCVSKIMSIL